MTTAIFAILSLLSFSIQPDIVPGRMGMLIILYLIQINTYNSVKAPPKRGFSSIEVWFLGMQFPILIAIFEYGILLASKKFLYQTIEGKNFNPEKLFKNTDLFFFLICSIYFVIFTLWYFMYPE